MVCLREGVLGVVRGDCGFRGFCVVVGYGLVHWLSLGRIFDDGQMWYEIVVSCRCTLRGLRR